MTVDVYIEGETETRDHQLKKKKKTLHYSRDRRTQQRNDFSLDSVEEEDDD